MNRNDLQSQVTLGEDSRRQFKRDVGHIDLTGGALSVQSKQQIANELDYVQSTTDLPIPECPTRSYHE